MEPSHYRSFLVPLDGSTAAQAAFHFALRLAAPGGEVVVTNIINRALIVAQCTTPYGGDPMPALEAIECDQRGIFAAAVAQAQAANVRVATVALDGESAASILTLAKERDVDALAMGTHGRRGLERLLLGNTAAAVLDYTELPTFVLHEQSSVPASAAFEQIVVALDATPAARAAARAAVDLAARDAARVVFAHVADRTDGVPEERAATEAAAYAHSFGVRSDIAILHGEPAQAIINCAQTCHAGLIAAGTRGRSGAPFRMGSVAQEIARTSPVAVLVLPAPAQPRAAAVSTPARATQSLGT